MDQNIFRSSPDVISFTEWLAERHRTLSIDLAIKSSRFVPGGIETDLIGLDALLPCYRWRAIGTGEGKWSATRQYLRDLGNALKQAIDAANDTAVFEICQEILAWGGDHNQEVGAAPFLRKMRDEGTLADYLDRARRAFILDRAIIDERLAPVSKMNSMLTKVHALASGDGLPIYDSRVAAAIAALVELWRREVGRTSEALPAQLTFPATMPDRSVQYLLADAREPGVLSYARSNVVETATRWSAAKIRLGWLMRGVLEKAPTLFQTEEEESRMHAFEASLFMIGYDITCLMGNLPGYTPTESNQVKLQRAGRARIKSDHVGLPRKTIGTLRGDKSNLIYVGDLDTGISGVWGKTGFAFPSEFLQEALAEFHGSEVGLGACMTGNVEPDTLGFWLDTHYPGKRRRDMSALAAIFVDQGLAERVEGRGIRILFL